MVEDVILFAAVGFAAQMIDGAIGMAYGLSATSVLLSLGVAPATASASVHAAEVVTTGASALAHWRLGNVRRELVRQGLMFETENDTEVAAAYLSSKMAAGMDLRQALQSSLKDLDGFFTFVVGTKSGFGVLRDPIACKPAVLAETDQFVAFGSEYRALADLPGIEAARVWEAEPSTVYFWEH